MFCIYSPLLVLLLLFVLLNQDDVSESFLTADRHTDTHMDRHTTHTLHTHGRTNMVITQFRSDITHTHTRGGQTGEKTKERGRRHRVT